MNLHSLLSILEYFMYHKIETQYTNAKVTNTNRYLLLQQKMLHKHDTYVLHYSLYLYPKSLSWNFNGEWKFYWISILNQI